jgi:hypothetical protein
MGKAIGFLLAVVAIWVTVEVYTQGVGNAFGGYFTPWIGDPSPERRSTVQRVEQSVGRASSERDARYEKLLPE